MNNKIEFLLFEKSANLIHRTRLLDFEYDSKQEL